MGLMSKDLFGDIFLKYTLIFQPKVKLIRYVDRLTIVEWEDGTKTIVKCGENEVFDKYAGFCAAVVKKIYGSTSAAKKIMARNDSEVVLKKKEEEALAKKELAEKERVKQKEKRTKKLARWIANIKNAERYARENGLFNDR